MNELEDGMQAREAKRQRKMAKDNRVICGARRRRDGQPCQALSVPGKRRCKWHGGCSTGPRTVEGKARVAANLRKRASPSRKYFLLLCLKFAVRNYAPLPQIV